MSSAAPSSPPSGLAAEIARLAPWFHNLHLPDGTQTAPGHPLGDFPRVKWRQIAPFIPTDLGGWRALDIGCNAGFYSFELARRGAHVTGIDIDPHYLRQAEWAARQFGLEDRVRFVRSSVYQLPRGGAHYDLVWFLGVLYHLRYPLLALDLVRGITRRQMVLQTLTMPGRDVLVPPPDMSLEERHLMLDPAWPKMAFIEKELEHDPTNWWAPNHACVEAMLRSAGFVVAARPGHEIYVCEPDAREPQLAAELRETELRSLFGPGAVPPQPKERLS